LNAYNSLGRLLGSLDGMVTTTRVGISGESYFLRYSLSDEGAEWLKREFDL